MSDNPQKSRYYRSNRIKEVNYNRQAADMFQRFTKHLGATIHKKTGQPVFTSYNVWMHAPTLQHPEANFKIQLGNGHSGSIFATVSIDEYYTLLQEQLDWIEKFKPYINLARNNSLELKRRRHILNTTGNILNDLELPSDPIERALEEKILESGLPDNIHTPRFDEQLLKDKLQLLIKDFHKTNSQELKQYYFSQMMHLLPSPELINELRRILYSGETTDTIYNSPDYESILNSPNSPEEPEIFQEIPLDIDLNFLYNIKTTYLPNEEISESTEEE